MKHLAASRIVTSLFLYMKIEVHSIFNRVLVLSVGQENKLPKLNMTN